MGKRNSRKKSVKKNPRIEELLIINQNAAGIDVGSEEHWVCVPGRYSENVRRFGAFTSDLKEIAKWLNECEVTTVVMESTGVYWIPLYEVLEESGFEIYLSNVRHAKNVPGRHKTDRIDCKWLQKLHTYGLLSASFIPPSEIRELKVLMRHRDNLIRESFTNSSSIDFVCSSFKANVPSSCLIRNLSSMSLSRYSLSFRLEKGNKSSCFA